MSGDIWHNHVDVTWHPMGVTHGKSLMVHLCKWITCCQVSNDEIMGNEQIHENKGKWGNKTCGKEGKWGGSFPTLPIRSMTIKKRERSERRK